MPATVAAAMTEPVGEAEDGVTAAASDDPDEVVAAPGPDVGLGLVLGVGLTTPSGAATAPGAAEQVVATVVTGSGFGVAEVLPTGAAVPPVNPVWLGADDPGVVWLALTLGDWLGFVGIVRLGGAMLLWLGLSGAGEGDGVCVGVGVGPAVWARRMPQAPKIRVILHTHLIPEIGS